MNLVEQLRADAHDPGVAPATALQAADEIEHLRRLVADALAELRQPIDLEAVLDTHAGRALWGATKAGNATRILARAELATPASSNQETK